MTETMLHELADLYVRLYFDEDVAVAIADNLRTRGFDVLTARDRLMLQRTDEFHLAFAISEQRAVITHNRVDFEALHQTCLKNAQPHWGVIIAKRRANNTEVVARLLQLLNTTSREDMQNQLRYI